MANVMSMLEKLKLVEKIDKEENIIVGSPVDMLDEIKNEKESIIDMKEKEGKEEVIDFGGYKPPTPPPEKVNIPEKNEIDKILSITEIYNKSGIEPGNLNTVFLLENFINALPQNLPHDIKKQSVVNIVSAASSDLNTLIAEGENRIKVLNDFMNDFQKSVNDKVIECQTEIMKLSKMIDKYNGIIGEKGIMLEEQKNIVKFEAQKINNIIDFFNDDKY